jgi:hypothetical protein
MKKTPSKDLSPLQIEILTFVSLHPGCKREHICWHLAHWQMRRWDDLRACFPDREPAPWLWPTSEAHPMPEPLDGPHGNAFITLD